MNTEQYMRRAIALAGRAEGVSLPNPMVGCVIVAPDDLIIGEGFTDVCGKGHAEVQAVRSVRPEHRHLLPESTAYVTLEPCSHYGKTPPCALLLAEKRLRRVVIGCVDPNPNVSGRGAAMLREAGVEVVMAPEHLQRQCEAVNRIFFHTQLTGLPWVTLKWAQSADGYMDRRRTPDEAAARFSSPLSSVLVHRLRARRDAILVGSGTVIWDSPRLDTRLSGGFDPLPVVLDGRGRITAAALRTARPALIINGMQSYEQLLKTLRDRGVGSILVEGGAQTLRGWIDSGLWCEARVEVSPDPLGDRGGVPAPAIGGTPSQCSRIDRNIVLTYINGSVKALKTPKNA